MILTPLIYSVRLCPLGGLPARDKSVVCFQAPVKLALGSGVPLFTLGFVSVLGVLTKAQTFLGSSGLLFSCSLPAAAPEHMANA